MRCTHDWLQIRSCLQLVLFVDRSAVHGLSSEEESQAENDARLQNSKSSNFQTGQYKTQTTGCRLQIGFKMQTGFKRKYALHLRQSNTIASPPPKKIGLGVGFIKSIIKAVLTLDASAENPAMVNYSERLEHMRAKQLVMCLYLYHIYRTMGNR